MKPLISVIIPVYNGQDYLEKCIESVTSQTCRNLEIIIVNDGSTDNTGQICERLAGENKDIHIISMQDEGVSAARNAGMEEAKGELFTFVDADDRLRERTLEILYQELIRTDSDICGCSFFPWREEAEWKQRKADRKEPGETLTYTGTEYLEQEILNGNSRCWSKLYRRSVIGGLRFRKELTIGEDMLFLVELLSKVKRISEVDYAGYGYFQNPAGAMNRSFSPRYMDQITCWELAREVVFGNETKETGKEAAMEAIQSAEIPGSRQQEKISSIIIMAILLTAGKLALLSGKERKRQKTYVEICHRKLKKELQLKEAYTGLSAGYKIKAGIFSRFPGIYLWLYHFRKYKRTL